MATVLHLAPHPDDELLAAGGTLLRLRDAGWRVVNLACSLGRPEDHARRRGELETACARAGFALRVPAAPIALGSRDDRTAARAATAQAIEEAVADLAPALIVGPSPHDDHPGHQVVGEATAEVLADHTARPRWWLWNLWGDATPPTLLVDLDETLMRRAEHALAAHAGELARNDYARLLRARAAAHAVAGPERVLGFGSPGGHGRYSDVLCELLTDQGDGWPLAAGRRWADGEDPLAGAALSGADAGAWLRAPAPTALMRGATA